MSTPDRYGVEPSGHRADPGTGRPDQTEPEAVLVDEAVDAGVVQWLVDRVVDDQVALLGQDGLLPALAEAVRHPVAAGPVRFTVTWDPTSAQRIAVDCDPGCTMATVRDVCVLIAATCTDLRPSVSIVRDDRVIQRL
jgi:hypothetical protein